MKKIMIKRFSRKSALTTNAMFICVRSWADEELIIRESKGAGNLCHTQN